MKTHDDNGNMIDHEPIDSFISDLEAIPTDEWRARTLAFESLTSQLPDAPVSQSSSSIIPWYKSATALRRLNQPISSLLLDARSTVAKHTCQHLAFLVQRTMALSPQNADICKYLLKDLLPSILGLHAQTVKTIRSYALDMIAVIIPSCRFKSGLPVLLERLRKDKSRDVREACVQYLFLILRHWTKDMFLHTSDHSAVSSISSGGETRSRSRKEDYLTKSICVHIGNGIARALMDSSQSVRKEATGAFELFRCRYPDLWNQIVQKQDGILSKDPRLRKKILNAAIKADNQGKCGHGVDEIHSNSFEDDFDGVSVVSGGTQNSTTSWNSISSFASKNSHIQHQQKNYNKRSASNGRTGRTGIRAGPVRVPANNQKQLPLPPSGKRESNSNSPPPPPQCMTSDLSNADSHVQHINKEIDPSTSIDDNGDGAYNITSTPEDVIVTDPAPDVVPAESNDTTITPSPPISLPLPQPNSAPFDGRRSSLLLQERLKGAESAREDTNGTSGTNGESSGGNSGDDNLIVASQLLQAHKTYIDELMENLRLEMNVVRDFEAVVAKAKKQKEDAVVNGDENRSDDVIHPSEDEVLGYFETVYSFLDKGGDNSLKLRQAMDNISRAGI